MWNFVYIFCILAAFLWSVRADEESCFTFAGGSVYPGDQKNHKIEHSLQITKAVISKYLKINVMIPQPIVTLIIFRHAPNFEGTAVVNGEFKKISLSDYLGKYVVFFFYPLDFTFVCPTEILAFSDRIDEFRAIDTEVIACSVDSQFTHLACKCHVFKLSHFYQYGLF